MVSVTSYNGKAVTGLLEIVGLSSDNKPIKTVDNYYIMNGSTFLEMDTGMVYFYDEEAQQWTII